MTKVLQFPVSYEIPAAAPKGNPDQVTVFDCFPNGDTGSAWLEQVAIACRQNGDISERAFRRLSDLRAGHTTVEGATARHQVRSVAALYRPSGRVASVVVAHLALHAERVSTPEGCFVEIRVGAPQVHHNGEYSIEAVAEAAMLKLLDQMEVAAVSLADSLRQAGDCVLWSLPTRSCTDAVINEMNTRLLSCFFCGDAFETVAARKFA